MIYCVMQESQLPTVNYDDENALEQFWFSVSCMQKRGDTSQKRFSNLSRLCKTLLVLPHSNADTEQLFSMVQKVQTEHRGSLNPSIVQYLMRVKMNTDPFCFNQLFNNELLSSAKSVSMHSLNQAV